MSATSFDIGDTAVLTFAFTDPASGGIPQAPATVICRVANGSGSEVATYIYGQGTLLATGTGAFTVNQPISPSFGWGHWHWRTEGYGPGSAETFTFFVRNPAPFG